MENFDNFYKNDLQHLLITLEDVIERFYSQNLLDGDDMLMVLGLQHTYRSLFLYMKGLKLHEEDN